MAEGARLESVYRGNSIQGSNPCLSAIPNSLNRLLPLFVSIHRITGHVPAAKLRLPAF